MRLTLAPPGQGETGPSWPRRPAQKWAQCPRGLRPSPVGRGRAGSGFLSPCKPSHSCRPLVSPCGEGQGREGRSRRAVTSWEGQVLGAACWICCSEIAVLVSEVTFSGSSHSEASLPLCSCPGIALSPSYFIFLVLTTGNLPPVSLFLTATYDLPFAIQM